MTSSVNLTWPLAGRDLGFLLVTVLSISVKHSYSKVIRHMVIYFYLPDTSSSVVITRGVSLLAGCRRLVGVAIETDQSAELSEVRVGTAGDDACRQLQT